MSRDILADLQAAAVEKLTGGDVRAVLRTNIAPPITIYSGASQGPGLLQTLGIKAAVTITDANGRQLTTLGTAAPTDWIRAAIIWGGLGYLAAVFGRGLLK